MRGRSPQIATPEAERGRTGENGRRGRGQKPRERGGRCASLVAMTDTPFLLQPQHRRFRKTKAQMTMMRMNTRTRMTMKRSWIRTTTVATTTMKTKETWTSMPRERQKAIRTTSNCRPRQHPSRLPRDRRPLPRSSGYGNESHRNCKTRPIPVLLTTLCQCWRLRMRHPSTPSPQPWICAGCSPEAAMGTFANLTILRA